MCQWLIENKADAYDFIFTFANTGLEHEKTLEFVDQCDKHFGLNLVWLEAVVNPEKGKGIRHKIVDFETASRNGEPFEAAILKYGIFNQPYPNCTGRLKREVIESYKRSIGLKTRHLTAIGIRSDEIDRMSPSAKKSGWIYPLINMTEATKASVRHWWTDQSFDLDLPEHLGNCVTCWKKSNRKLMTIAKHEPERFEFMDRMERENSHIKCGGKPRSFFRQNKTAQDIIAAAQQPFNEFVDRMPELQLGMFEPMDLEADCGAGCEIQ